MIYTSIFNTFLSESFGISNFYINFAADFGETATEATRPDGGIGRRAGLKHQWGNPCRFDPGSGYFKYKTSKAKCCRLSNLQHFFDY